MVEYRTRGNRAFCTINEGLGKVMRVGGNDASVLKRLGWLRDTLGPALGAALRVGKGIDLKPLVARGLTMGDEMHQRNLACSSLLLRTSRPALAPITYDPTALPESPASNAPLAHILLHTAQALSKSMADSAQWR